MPRRIVATGLPPQPDPEPRYPQYAEVRAEARRRSGGPIGQQTIDRMREVVGRRGRDWCSAVLGRSFPGLGLTSTTDNWMFLVADEQDLKPALPTWIIAERQAAKEQRAGREQAAAASLQIALEAWRQLGVTAPVPLTVHENIQHSGVKGRLRHMVAAVDLVSGRTRKHPKGAGLCESEQRSKPLQLGDAVDLPPTCQRCKAYVPQVRTLDAPTPPTAAEKALLQLIASGAVFTMRPGRGQPTIRDTRARGHGTAWGQLGRKVDAAVKRLEAKGWAQIEDTHSRTQLGNLGNRWLLTEAGTAAMEGCP